MEMTWKFLQSRHPALHSVTFVPLPVLDRRYVSWGSVLSEGAEVSFLPPLGGG